MARAAAPGDHLVFTAAPQEAGLSAPTPGFVVTRRDGAGSPLTGAALSVSLSSTSAAGEFVAGSGAALSGWSAPLALNIASGESSATFAYRDGTVGSPVLTASAAGLADATQTLTVLPEILEDDFESGSLLLAESPPGKWTNQHLNEPLNTFTPVPAAAHRGALGIRLEDVTAMSGSTQAGGVRLVTRDTAASIHGRAWIRLVSSNGLGSLSFLVAGQVGVGGDLMVLRMNSGNALVVQHQDDSTLRTTTPTSVVVEYGAYALYEFRLEGLGTGSGSWQVAVDGATVAQSAGLAWTTIPMSAFVLLGFEPDGQFTGVVDTDDVRLSTLPLASTLRLRVLDTAPRCVPVEVRLVDTFRGEEARAPYDVAATLTADAGGAYFADSTCTQVTSTVSFARGTSSAQIVYFAAAQDGPVQLTASHDDFRPAAETATLRAGLGPGALLRTYRVGCGCEHASTGGAASLALIALLLACTGRYPPRG